MIHSRHEYHSMYQVERKLWWYRILHEKVLRQIVKHFGKRATGISFLDAACGTGGLLSFLKERNFTRLTGFDYSPHAIEFSRARGLDVGFGDLRDIASFRKGEKYDLITCNDALYFLSDEEIVASLQSFKSRLNEKGVLVINIHAHEAFAGTHDIAVGSTRRFTIDDFRIFSDSAGLRITYYTYWPFLLSLPIWLVRSWQRYQVRKRRINLDELKSDVSYPGDLINSVLKMITDLEGALFSYTPFGSSLFLVMKK